MQDRCNIESTNDINVFLSFNFYRCPPGSVIFLCLENGDSTLGLACLHAANHNSGLL